MPTGDTEAAIPFHLYPWVLTPFYSTIRWYEAISPDSLHCQSTLAPYPILLLTLVISCCSGYLKSCYYESGSIANDFPRDPAANVSTCYVGSYYCTKSFYCVNGIGSRIVRRCTDRTKQDPACPLHYVRHALISDKSRSNGANSDNDNLFSHTQYRQLQRGTFCLNPDDQTISECPCACMFGMGKDCIS